MPVIEIGEIFLKALAPFEKVFSKPQVMNFRRLIFGIILCLESRNIADINEKTWRDKDQSSLNRFLTASPWKKGALGKARRELLGRRLKEEKPSEVYLIIDDSIAHKWGKKMEGVGWHYCDTDKKVMLGHNLVSSTVVVVKEGAVAYQTPLDVALYRKKGDCEKGREFQSKIALAIQFVQEFETPVGTRPILLIDSWYASASLLSISQSEGFDYVTPLKSNRVVFLNRKRTKLAQLARRGAGWKRITVKKERFWVTTHEVFLKGLGMVNLVISKRQRYGTSFKAFITSRLDWSPSRILNAYAHRWAIETVYEDTKVHLGLDQYQIRKAEGIEKYWEIVFTAYQFLEEANRLMPRRRRLSTIGQKCLWVRKVFTRSLVEWLFRKRHALSDSQWDRLCQELCL